MEDAKNETVIELNAAAEPEKATEADGIAPAQGGKIDTPKSANYTHTFSKPVEIAGKKFTAMTFYFDRLTGYDMELIEEELQNQDKFVLAPETSAAYQAMLAARAAGIGADEIRRLPLVDYVKIKNKARAFLLSMA